MPARVIDANVLAVADGHATHASPECQARCAESLELARTGLVIIDSSGEILLAYESMARLQREPGIAAAFYRWLSQAQGDRRHCRQVDVQRDATGEFVAYPRDPEFAAFDRDDRIYVVTAIGSDLRPDLVNATDSDWLAIAHALERYRVRLRNLCLPNATSTRRRKPGTGKA